MAYFLTKEDEKILLKFTGRKNMSKYAWICKIGKDKITCDKKNCENCRHWIQDIPK